MGSLEYWDDKGNNLSILYELFDSWNNVLNEYDNAWGKYVAPHVYIQQTQVGYLAVAARDVGWLPQLEFSIERRTNKREFVKGRCDLALWCKNKKRETELFFEVETCTYSVKINEQQIKELITLFEATKENVRHIREARGSPAIAVVLVRLCNASLDDVASDLWARLRKIRRRLRSDFCALNIRGRQCMERTPIEWGGDCLGIAAFGSIKGHL